MIEKRIVFKEEQRQQHHRHADLNGDFSLSLEDADRIKRSQYHPQQKHQIHGFPNGIEQETDQQQIAVAKLKRKNIVEQTDYGKKTTNSRELKAMAG
ncbi:hypothetical protein HMPREF1870_02780 [Bacteroidales bacterium KA00344]|nr:hypothetical protein HMPREF1870_02780 [Bacteroidales bacterium KA00344]